MAKTQEVYSLDDLHVSINDIYTQYDGGKITLQEANQLAMMCCLEFAKHTKEQERICVDCE